jgi:hypothetical protein
MLRGEPDHLNQQMTVAHGPPAVVNTGRFPAPWFLEESMMRIATHIVLAATLIGEN